MLVPAAKNSVLGYMFQQAGKSTALWSYVPILFLFLLGMFVYSKQGGLLASGMLAGTLLIFYALRRKIIRWFGGITGDIVGASVEGVEVFLWLIL